MTNLFKGIEGSPITSLVSDITSSQTTIEVADGDSLPDAPNICTIGYGENLETIKYKVKSNGVLQNVTRGVEGTPRAWQKGTEVARIFTAYDHNAIIDDFNSHKAESAKEAHGETYELIQSGTLNSASVLNIAGIPQNYTHLRIVINGRANVSGSGISNIGVRFNDISTESYFNQSINSVGSNLSSKREITTSVSGRMKQLEFSGKSVLDITIYNYTSNENKLISSKYMVAGSNSAEHGEVSTLFTLGAAINKITSSIYMGTGTEYYLYGIKS